VKERFFREAETAGRLSHPNIVTIYDAGEEHDLCYIAMELLKGGDLVPFSKAGNLLPVDKTVSIIARLTDSSKTKTGMVLGTPSFMSPEQLAGGRSDLFSLAGAPAAAPAGNAGGGVDIEL
jgi:serine/threonine protein kinase